MSLVPGLSCLPLEEAVAEDKSITNMEAEAVEAGQAARELMDQALLKALAAIQQFKDQHKAIV